MDPVQIEIKVGEDTHCSVVDLKEEAAMAWGAPEFKESDTDTETDTDTDTDVLVRV